MVVFSNAKVNLGLYVLEKRSDGYHNIETCFYPIDYSDILEMVPSAETSFVQTGIEIPGKQEENLCLKAYHNLAQVYDLPPVSLHLHKIVPIGAGLGGGSSDAAHCLTGLNRLFDLGMTTQQLEEQASLIGSDCPFFIQSNPVIGLEKGDLFQSVQLDLSGYWIVVVTPRIHISSGEAYSDLVPKPRSERLTDKLENVPLEEWKEVVHNDFETTVFNRHPSIQEIKNNLYRHGAKFALLSGSGSSVFGIFDTEQDLTWLDQELTVWQGPL